MGLRSSKIDAADLEAVSKAICDEALSGAHVRNGVNSSMLDAFEEWDRDGNGWIDQAELGGLLKKLGVKSNKDQLLAIFAEIDLNGDGKIQYEEFCAWLCQAPYLEQYFQELLKIEKESLDLRLDMAHMQTDKDRQQAQRMVFSFTKGQWKERLHPLLSKSFDYHDKDHGGTLEEDESIIFFGNYCKLLINYAKIRWETVKSLSEDSPERYQEILDSIDADSVYYQKNPSSCHVAAFSFLDVNKDGRLSRDAVTQTLTPGNEKYEEFHRALKLGGWLNMFEAKIASTRFSSSPAGYGYNASG